MEASLCDDEITQSKPSIILVLKPSVPRQCRLKFRVVRDRHF